MNDHLIKDRTFYNYKSFLFTALGSVNKSRALNFFVLEITLNYFSRPHTNIKFKLGQFIKEYNCSIIFLF